MRVPIRKSDKYLRSKPDPQITPERFNELKRNLERLTKFVRPGLAKEVKLLASQGDFSENAGYQITKGRLRGVNQRIIEIEDMLARAEIIAPKKNSEVIEIGHKVTVEANGQSKTYLILGSTETDPSSGIISHKSPLGSVLLGHRVGETVGVKINNKQVEYKIIKAE